MQGVVHQEELWLQGGVAERVSGRNGPFQLRIRAGDSACVLTEGIGAFEVWLCLDAASRTVRGHLNNFPR